MWNSDCVCACACVRKRERDFSVVLVGTSV